MAGIGMTGTATTATGPDRTKEMGLGLTLTGHDLAETGLPVDTGINKVALARIREDDAL